MKREIVTRTGKVWDEGDGIIRYRVNDGAVERIDDARAMIAAVRELVGQVRHHTFIDIRGLKSTDRETRLYYSGTETADAAKGGGCAILVGSPMTALIGNLFLQINRPPYPTRIFHDETAALEWIAGLP